MLNVYAISSRCWSVVKCYSFVHAIGQGALLIRLRSLYFVLIPSTVSQLVFAPAAFGLNSSASSIAVLCPCGIDVPGRLLVLIVRTEEGDGCISF